MIQLRINIDAKKHPRNMILDARVYLIIPFKPLGMKLFQQFRKVAAQYGRGKIIKHLYSAHQPFTRQFSSTELHYIRNVGIVAHIDAGKSILLFISIFSYAIKLNSFY